MKYTHNYISINPKNHNHNAKWIDENPIWYDVNALITEAHRDDSLKVKLKDVDVYFKLMENKDLTKIKLFQLENYGDDNCVAWIKQSVEHSPIWFLLKNNTTANIGDSFDVRFIRVEKINKNK